MYYLKEGIKLRLIKKYDSKNIKTNYSEIYKIIYESAANYTKTKTYKLLENEIEQPMRIYLGYFIQIYSFRLTRWIEANEDIYLDINIVNILSLVFSLEEKILENIYEKYPEFEYFKKNIDIEKFLLAYNCYIAFQIYLKKISFWRFLRRNCEK